MTDLRLSGWELLFIFVFATSSLNISAAVIALQIELLFLSFLPPSHYQESSLIGWFDLPEHSHIRGHSCLHSSHDKPYVLIRGWFRNSYCHSAISQLWLSFSVFLSDFLFNSPPFSLTLNGSLLSYKHTWYSDTSYGQVPSPFGSTHLSNNPLYWCIPNDLCAPWWKSIWSLETSLQR